MNRQHEPSEPGSDFTKPPFLYEIRVKGRLSSEQWTDWFNDLTVSVGSGESVLRGSAVDHAALYGLLARLRDLAIPLASVRVLDAEAQRRLAQQSRRYDLMINGVLAAIYLALLGGLATLTVLFAPIINPALAMAFLFALLGGLAHAFWLWSGQAPWRWLTYVAWPAAVITFVIYIPVSGLLPPTVGIAVLFFLLAGGLLYLLSFLRRHAEEIRAHLPGRATPDSPEEPASSAPTKASGRDAPPGG
jgi:hypothetical protein